MLYGGDSTGGREREMAVICSVNQSAFTQYHQDEMRGEERRGEERRGEERRGEERRGEALRRV